MSLERLRTEIESDPAGLGYSALSDEDLATKLNAKERSRLRVLSSAELLAWSLSDQRKSKLREAAATHASADIREIADGAMILLQRETTVLDLNLADRVAMVGALVAAGVLNQADSDALSALATVSISRLEEIGIGEMHLGDVQWARRSGPWAA